MKTKHTGRPSGSKQVAYPKQSKTFAQRGALAIEMVAPARLKPANRNARTHSKKQIGQIAASITEFGFNNPIVVNDEGRIIAGHGRWEAAKQLGLRAVPVVTVSNLSETQIRAYMLADNALALRSGWDREVLEIEFKELSASLAEIGLDLEITGFEPSEIDAIMEGFSDEPTSPADEIPTPANGPFVSRVGDLFLLGRHRLLVADARDLAAYPLLMCGEAADMGIHDPPFNVRVQGHIGGRGAVKHPEFAHASGEMTVSQFTKFLTDTLKPAAEHSADGAIHYVFMDWRHLGEVLAAGMIAFDELKNLCVWVKTNAGQGSFYRSAHELVLVFKHGSGPHQNNFGLGGGGRARSNVWRYAGVNTFRAGRMDELKMHPTVKPVALVVDAMRDCSRRGSIVLDVFAGSGTTIIAAEQIGRRAFCMEIEPRYVDVAIRRWQKFTGRDAVLEATGETFGELDPSKVQQPAQAEASAMIARKARRGSK
jgi:hypothetical protein